MGAVKTGRRPAGHAEARSVSALVRPLPQRPFSDRNAGRLHRHRPSVEAFRQDIVPPIFPHSDDKIVTVEFPDARPGNGIKHKNGDSDFRSQGHGISASCFKTGKRIMAVVEPVAGFCHQHFHTEEVGIIRLA